ncbi:MAG: metallophosphoesterase [Candidatus Bathyarchaeia archaeon]
MKVGIIADTHDRLSFIDKAVRRLNLEHVEIVLHAGDYIAPFVASHFKPLKAKMIGVFGNNDGEQNLLRKKFEEIGIQILGRFAEVNLDSLKIALLHGHEDDLLKSLISLHESGAYSVIAYGHTHRTEVKKLGKTLIINPGEVCGYLSGNSTFAILDTKTLDVEIVYLNKPKDLTKPS